MVPQDEIMIFCMATQFNLRRSNLLDKMIKRIPNSWINLSFQITARQSTLNIKKWA